MNNNSTKNKQSNRIIDCVEVTNDTLTSRGGLSLFVRYLRGIGLLAHLESVFGSIRKSRKGQSVTEIFKQLFCFFVDGTSRHLVYFDTLKRDEGYGASIETEPDQMLSSHGVKRFFKAIYWPTMYVFRLVLLQLFLWRLQVVQPELIELGLDTMVMDNNDAEKRHGVKPIYKNHKGFQPLQLSWGRFINDALFRAGDAHSNHGQDVEKMLRHIVSAIRKHYRADVAIVLRMDSGFFDQKLFEVFEQLQIGYICGGKLYDDVKAYVSQSDESFWGRYEQSEQVWQFIEMGDRRGNWKQFRRAIFCRPLCEERQYVFDFQRPDTIIYTNLGMGGAIDEKLKSCGRDELLSPQGLIKSYHDRGCDELVNRALKDFGCEQLPFKRFGHNAAFYYTMIIAFFLYESFKLDVCSPVVKVTAYAITVRRQLIDIAAKVVRHSGKIILKVTRATFQALNFAQLWEKSAAPPQFVWH
ncbi:MAG: IS1380 family transposase [Deltaproteobacteria bacterium]|nr:IS1380 family transposase [Deltaproteobacteria bacterium]MBW2154525.1 IS1380 family transposase [Deltaproteobacteria bacterium]